MSPEAPGLGSVDRRPRRFSVVIPVMGSTDGLADVIGGYGEGLIAMGEGFEVILIPGRDQAAICAELTRRHEWLAACDPHGGGWGRAVRAGLAASAGEILCYTNWVRTPAAALMAMLRYAGGSSELVLRANRRTRDTRRQRLGSLLFNLECRALLGTSAWDINGTPKIFSRERTKLLELTRDDELLDAEFALVCELEGYPVAEVPIDAPRQDGHHPAPSYFSAWLMYSGVPSLRRRRAVPEQHAR